MVRHGHAGFPAFFFVFLAPKLGAYSLLSHRITRWARIAKIDGLHVQEDNGNQSKSGESRGNVRLNRSFNP